MTGFRHCAIIVVCFSCVCIQGCGSERVDRFSHAEHVDRLLEFHRTLAGGIHTTNALVIVSFFDNGQIAFEQHVWVEKDAKKYERRFTPLAGQGGEYTLRAETVKAIQRVIADLPPDQLVPDEKLFVVGCESSGKWVTHKYDRTNLPLLVKSLSDLMGIPPTWL